MKKIISLLVSGIIALSVIACGGQSQATEESVLTGMETESKEMNRTEEESEDTVSLDQEPLVLVKQITNSNAYSEYIYDENGRIIMEVTYFKGEVSHRYVYTYAAQENGTTLLRIMDEIPDGTGYEVIYDTDGRCVEKIEYWSGNTDPEKMFSSQFIRGRNSYEYDENDRLLMHTYTNQGGDGTIYTYGYDDAGRIVFREEKQVGTETVTRSEEFIRDENGDVIQCNRYSAAYGESVGEYEWNYSYNYEQTWVTRKVAKPINQKIDYDYNEEGSLLQMTVDDQLGTLPEELYLKNGHLVKLCEYSKFVMMPLSEALMQQGSGQ